MSSKGSRADDECWLGDHGLSLSQPLPNGANLHTEEGIVRHGILNEFQAVEKSKWV